MPMFYALKRLEFQREDGSLSIYQGEGEELRDEDLKLVAEGVGIDALINTKLVTDQKSDLPAFVRAIREHPRSWAGRTSDLQKSAIVSTSPVAEEVAVVCRGRGRPRKAA